MNIIMRIPQRNRKSKRNGIRRHSENSATVPGGRLSNSTEEASKCSECGRIFANSSYLLTHLRYDHNKGKPFKCDRCDSRFTQRGSMMDHIRDVHEKRDHKCPDCDKSFSNRSGMKTHMRAVHPSPERTFSCALCPAKFTRKANLNSHLKKVHRRNNDVGLQNSEDILIHGLLNLQMMILITIVIIMYFVILVITRLLN
jgi:uncharacterized Zn-finger protein